MTDAITDENGAKGITCALNTDGKTIIRIQVNPTNHSLKAVDASTGTDHGKSVASVDGNGQKVWLGVSSADGITPIEIYADSSGNLLIDST